jgi:DNA-binding response OmpR family regulator
MSRLLKILIAEDELLVAKVMKLAFEKKGFSVKHVVDSAGVVNAADEFSPDFVIMDVCLKNKSSGIEAGQAIRKKNSQLPIIFTTGNSLEQTRDEIKDIGCTHLFIKPVDADLLIAYIEKELYTGSLPL